MTDASPRTQRSAYGPFFASLLSAQSFFFISSPFKVEKAFVLSLAFFELSKREK